MNKFYNCNLNNNKTKLHLFLAIVFLCATTLLRAQESTEHWFAPVVQTTPLIGGGFISNGEFGLSTTSDVDVTVEFFQGTDFTTPAHTLTITANGTALVNGTNLNLNPWTAIAGINNSGVYIRASAPISVDFRISNGAQADILTSKGINARGMVFRGVGTPNGDTSVNGNFGPADGTVFVNPTGGDGENNYSAYVSIYAVENTTVSISNLITGAVIEGINGGSAVPTNHVETVNLMAGQSYLLKQRYRASDLANSDKWNALIGTLIESTTGDITVSAGSLHANRYSGPPVERDFTSDQIVPVGLLGTDHILSRGNGPDIGEYVIVVAHSNNTSIFLNGESQAEVTLKAGEHYIINKKVQNNSSPASTTTGYTTKQNMFLRTTNPAYVMQHVSSPLGTQAGMFLVPSTRCSAPREAYIINPHLIGAVAHNTIINIATESIATIDISTDGGVTFTTLQSFLDAGTIVNYGTNNINGHFISGSTTFVSYQLSGTALNQTILVRSSEAMYLGLIGAAGMENYGGYYSGFDPVVFLESDENTSCLPVAISITQDFDEYRWYKDGVLFILEETTDEFGQTFTATEGGTYFAEARYLGCEWIRSSNNMVLDLEVALPGIIDDSITYCAADAPTLQNLEDDLVFLSTMDILNGDTLLWYDDVGNLLPVTTVLTDNTTYNVSRLSGTPSVVDGVTHCESGQISILVGLTTFGVPVVNLSIQNYCFDDSPLVADIGIDLPVNAIGVNWYDALVGGNLIPATTPLIHGKDYFGQAVFQGVTCAGNQATRVTFTASIDGEILISSPLEDQTVCHGNDATFTAVATPGNAGVLAYVWEEDTGSGFTVIPGVTTATYTKTNVQTADHGNLYRVSVTTSQCTIPVTSSASLNVEGLVTINTQPTNVTVCQGSSHIFTVDASSGVSGILSYVWEESLDSGTSWNIVSTEKNFSKSGIMAGENGNRYRVKIRTASCSEITSTEVTLSVDGPVQILEAVDNASTCVGGDASFTVQALTGNIGATPLYLWEVDTNLDHSYENIGATPGLTFATGTDDTAQTLALTNIPAAASSYRFRVSVTTANCGIANTSSATLKVEGPINNLAITSSPNDNIICEGDLFTLSATATTAQGNINYIWEESPDNTVGSYSTVGVGTTLLLSNVSVNKDAFFYRVKASTDECADNAISTPVQLRVTGPLSFTQELNNQTICSGNTVSFSAAVDAGTFLKSPDTDIIYYWEKRLPATTTFVPVNIAETTDGIITANTLNLKPMAITTNGNLTFYRVSAENSKCTSPISSTAILTLEGPITFTEHPATQVKCAGDAVLFETEAVTAGSGEITYEWEQSTDSGSNWSLIGTGRSLVLSNLFASQNQNQYRAVAITAECTRVTSNIATLTVQGAINIDTGVTDQTICRATGAATFSVTASVPATDTSSTIAYQWLLSTDGGTSFAQIPGETAATLSLIGLDETDDGNLYKVEISTSACSTALESIGRLNVEGPLSVAAQPADVVTCENSAAVFSVTPANLGSGTVAVTWEVDRADTAAGTWTFIGTGNTLNITSVTSLDNGNQYRAILTSGSCTGVGSVTSATASLTVSGGAVINSFLEDQMVCADGTGPVFVIDASLASGSATFTWTREDTPGSGTYSAVAATETTDGIINTNTLSLNTVATADIANFNSRHYRVVVSAGSACPATSLQSTATLFVEGPIVIDTQPMDQMVCAGGTAIINVAADALQGSGSLSYQWEEQLVGSTNWIPIGMGTTLVRSNLASTQNGNKYRVIVSAGTACTPVTSNEVTLTVEGPITIVTDVEDVLACDSDAISFSVNANTAAAGTLAYQWETSTDSATWSDVVGETTNTINLTADATTNDGVFYRVKIRTGACSTVTSNIGRLSVEGPIVIDTQPMDQTVCAGGTAIINVAADALQGSGSLSYQWEEQLVGSTNWIPIGMGTTLVRSNLSSTQNGNKYRVIVSAGTACTPVTSNEVTLTVEGPITIVTDVEDVLACDSDAISFSVNANAASAGTLAYQWESSTDGFGWTDIAGETSDNLSFSATAADNGKLYRARLATGACNAIISSIGRLTIKGQITINTQPMNQVVCSGDAAIFSIEVVDMGQNINYRWEESNDNGTTWHFVGGSSIYIKQTALEDNNNLYRVSVSAGGCSSIISDEVSLQINELLFIDEQPEDITADVGDTVSFSATLNINNASGLVWQVKDGADTKWTDLSDNLTYSGTTTLMLQINEIPYDLHKNRYRLIVSSPCNNRIITDDAQLELNLQIPDSFSPNGDGTNETFKIPLLYDYPNFSIEIFNRWGNKLYEYSDDGKSDTEPEWWDGTSRGQFNYRAGEVVPSATYFYVIHFNKPEISPKTGWVYLRK